MKKCYLYGLVGLVLVGVIIVACVQFRGGSGNDVPGVHTGNMKWHPNFLRGEWDSGESKIVRLTVNGEGVNRSDAVRLIQEAERICEVKFIDDFNGSSTKIRAARIRELWGLIQEAEKEFPEDKMIFEKSFSPERRGFRIVLQ